jgi:hypothetical protein
MTTRKYVQTEYPETHQKYLVGQIAQTVTCDIDSLELGGAADAPFGRAVSPTSVAGAGYRAVDLGVRRRVLALVNEADLTLTETDITYDGASDAIAAGTFIVIDSEIMYVSGVAATVLTVVRNQLGSAAATHDDDAAILAFGEVLFTGITVRNPTLMNGLDHYETGDTVSVLWRGDIAVKVPAAVTPDSDVVVATVASGADATREEVGQLSNKSADATHATVPRLRFLSPAAAQGVALLRVGW